MPNGKSVSESEIWMTNCMNALKYLQATLNEPLTVNLIKRAHKLLMHKKEYLNGKDVFIKEYRKMPVFAGFKAFAPASAIKNAMNATLD